ncbi:MAG: murein biosynthesis integral membrane protein MurJ, partial [Magnetococcales bacterium]|nr:murein biosynthesis integral membrane protein MurJ [Magnetococcales bacterium]
MVSETPNSHPPSPTVALAPSRRGLMRAMGTISLFTLLSRIAGFVRDMVIAHSFGAGSGADAFFVAFKLPNFLRRLFAEGAFNTAFIPVFSDYVARGDLEATRQAAQAIFTALLTILLAVVALGELGTPYLVYIAAPGFADQAETFQLTVELTRITFPYILFISLVALAGGILNSFHHFALPALNPVLLNLCLIFGALFLSPRLPEPTMGLAIGVFLGGVVQLALLLPALKRIGISLRFRWRALPKASRHPAIQQVLTLMGPSVLGVSVAQINLLVDLFIASWLPAGSISYLYYADRLVEFPLGLIGIAMGTAILPSFSARVAHNDLDGLRQDLDFSLRLILLITIPATAGLLALGEPILALLFERGAFGDETTRLTAQALLAYGLGLSAFSAIKIAAPVFYAFKDTRTPVRIAIVCMLANIVFSLLLLVPLQHAGLALATTLSAFLNAGLLLYHLREKVGYRPGGAMAMLLGKTLLATALMVLFLLWGRATFWDHTASTGSMALTVLPLIVSSLLLYVGCTWLLGMEEARALLRALR